MKKSTFFLTSLFSAAVRYCMVLFLSVILIVIGAIWSSICLYIGLGSLVLYLIVCVISAIRLQRMLNYRSEDNPEFNALMDLFTSGVSDPLENISQLSRDALLSLSNGDLFSMVYSKCFDIVLHGDDEAMESFGAPQETVFVLGLFDSEMQNGGLCQFFVNSSRKLAPRVSECLAEVGAFEHQKLFDDFVSANNIDLSDLTSFEVSGIRGYIRQTKRFGFEQFDECYYALSGLEDKIADYIRANISYFSNQP